MTNPALMNMHDWQQTRRLAKLEDTDFSDMDLPETCFVYGDGEIISIEQDGSFSAFFHRETLNSHALEIVEHWLHIQIKIEAA